MLQSYATNTGGNAKMWILDMAPDRNTPVHDAGGPDGRRWREGDGSPIRLLWDYHDAVLAVERNPIRYRVDGMSDADHGALVKAFEETKR
jgi:hypothetical protein